MIRSILALALTIGFAAILTPSLHAQTSGFENIDYFELNAVVDEMGTATITETIHYDLGSRDRRGIFRDIPSSFVVSEDQGYNLDLRVLSVTRNDQPETFVMENRIDNFETLRIGNEDVFLTGRQNYTITYELGPVVILADDGNAIIRLDAPGTGWDVGTDRVTLTIDGPANTISQTCFRGTLGSTNQSCDIGSGTGFVAYSSDNLQSGETITVEAVYTPETFSNFAVLETIEKPSDIGGIIVAGIAAFVGAAAGFFGVKRFISNIRYKSRRKDETIYPRYEPPKDMTPGDIGLLIDNSTNGAELSATILWLATSGYIKITQTKEKRFFRGADYSFTKLKESTGLIGYDKKLFDEMFNTAGDKPGVVTMGALKKSIAFAKVVQGLKSEHIDRLEAMGFYGPTNIFAADLDSRMTDAGYTKWGEIEGFRMFLNFTEKDRLAFLDAPEKKPEQFSKLLPYAVALNVEKQWLKQFKGLEIDTSGWYEGPNGFTTGYALGSLNQLSSDLNNFSTAATSSGTAGAGGGFSGGGFSGGGGGSW